MKGGLGIAVALAIFGFGCADATASVRYAEPGGDGADPCLLSDPCSLAAAAGLAHASDDVRLLPGGYTVTSQLSIGKPITVEADDPSQIPTITAASGSSGRILVLGTGAVLRDVYIQSAADRALTVGETSTVNRVQVVGTGSYACRAIEDAVMRNSVCASQTGGGGVGLLVDTGTLDSAIGNAAVTLQNDSIYAGAVNATALAIASDDGFDATVNANSVIAVAPNNLAGNDVFSSSGHINSTSTAVFDYSDYGFENEGDNTSITDPGSAHNITARPHFTSPGSNNFHEEANSPTVDAGDPAPAVGQLDFEGDPRVLDGVRDIGADEIDNEVLDTKLLTHPTKKIKTRKRKVKARFTFEARFLNGIPAVADLECNLDGSGFAPCASPFVAKVRSGRGKGRKHRFSVRAVDSDQVSEPTPARFNWRVKRRARH